MKQILFLIIGIIALFGNIATPALADDSSQSKDLTFILKTDKGDIERVWWKELAACNGYLEAIADIIEPVNANDAETFRFQSNYILGAAMGRIMDDRNLSFDEAAKLEAGISKKAVEMTMKAAIEAKDANKDYMPKMQFMVSNCFGLMDRYKLDVPKHKNAFFGK